MSRFMPGSRGTMARTRALVLALGLLAAAIAGTSAAHRAPSVVNAGTQWDAPHGTLVADGNYPPVESSPTHHI